MLCSHNHCIKQSTTQGSDTVHDTVQKQQRKQHIVHHTYSTQRRNTVHYYRQTGCSIQTTLAAAVVIFSIATSLSTSDTSKSTS
jgi:hypothetical protein